MIRQLKDEGFEKVVMMTGDSARAAAGVAAGIGIDVYDAEVLPDDKANFIRKEREAGNIVVMVGDGINDSPALSAADVGIAIRDGAEIAREISDVTIGAGEVRGLVVLRHLSRAVMRRFYWNYRTILGVNSVLILLGSCGVIPPATSAALHNMTTLGIGLRSMHNLLP